jgi:BMFP domain-containing protein YqiC
MADYGEVVRLIEGLSNEIQALDAKVEESVRELRQEMRNGFDRLDAPVERHGALLHTGSRWTNRMNQWAEKVDRMLVIWDERNERLEQRLRKLESGRPQS